MLAQVPPASPFSPSLLHTVLSPPGVSGTTSAHRFLRTSETAVWFQGLGCPTHPPGSALTLDTHLCHPGPELSRLGSHVPAGSSPTPTDPAPPTPFWFELGGICSALGCSPPAHPATVPGAEVCHKTWESANPAGPGASKATLRIAPPREAGPHGIISSVRRFPERWHPLPSSPAASTPCFSTVDFLRASELDLPRPFHCCCHLPPLWMVTRQGCAGSQVPDEEPAKLPAIELQGVSDEYSLRLVLAHTAVLVNSSQEAHPRTPALCSDQAPLCRSLPPSKPWMKLGASCDAEL